DFTHLFQAFNAPGKLPKLLVLCLPGIAGGILIGILAVIFIGGALIGAGVSASSNPNAAMAAGMGGGFILFMLLTLAIAVFVYALTFYATPRVMLDNMEAVPAMRESLSACKANIGALALYICVLLLAVI